MEMIWHQNPCVEHHVRTQLRCLQPFLLHNLPHRRKLHFSIHNLTENTLAIFHTDSDKVPATVRIIPSCQTRRFDTVCLTKECHRNPFKYPSFSLLLRGSG